MHALRLLAIAVMAFTFSANWALAEEAPDLEEIVGAPALGEPMEPALAMVEGARIGKSLRCPVCQGLSISDSPSEAARAALQRIQDLLMAGYTEAQIEDYFVDRYGEWALLAPRAAGLNWIVWLAPIVCVLVGVYVVRRSLTTGSGPDSENSVNAESRAQKPVDPYAQEVLALLEERDR